MWIKKKLMMAYFRSQGHMTTLHLVLNPAGNIASQGINPTRFEKLLQAFNAIEGKTPGDGWRLRLNGNRSTIENPVGSRVSLATIRSTQQFFRDAGLTLNTVAEFLA